MAKQKALLSWSLFVPQNQQRVKYKIIVVKWEWNKFKLQIWIFDPKATGFFFSWYKGIIIEHWSKDVIYLEYKSYFVQPVLPRVRV